jgi:hypothetical protein
VTRWSSSSSEISICAPVTSPVYLPWTRRGLADSRIDTGSSGAGEDRRRLALELARVARSWRCCSEELAR